MYYHSGDSNRVLEKKLVHGETLVIIIYYVEVIMTNLVWYNQLRDLRDEIRKAPLMYQHLYSSKALNYNFELMSLRSQLQTESKQDDDYEVKLSMCFLPLIMYFRHMKMKGLSYSRIQTLLIGHQPIFAEHIKYLLILMIWLLI